MVTAWTPARAVSAACAGCGWALVVDYAGPDEAVAAIQKCEAEGAKHESTIRRWLGWIWTMMRQRDTAQDRK